MAKNFGKSPAAKRFGEVAKTSAKNTNNTAVTLIESSDLEDYPDNGEDISYTADIEKSISELGFTDPVEVTGFGMPEGKYMIVSGHRRRAAGVKCGMDLFPCIIKAFENENDVRNYVLLSNSQRDSSKDPLLYCSRYNLHEQYLKSIKFQGSIREEIAKRLGISVQQADRYNQMNKVIPPVWGLVREEIVGMSSVLPMAVLSPKEQQDIFEILQKNIADKTDLTREKVKEIIENYKNPHRSPHGEDKGNQGNPGKSIIKTIKVFNNTLSKIDGFADKKDAENFLGEIEKTYEIIKNIIDKEFAQSSR